MTLSSVAADDPVEAPLMNQLIANVNGSPGVAVITSSGTWSVPAGVHKFRVTLCGGGGGVGVDGVGGSGEDFFVIRGGPGGDSIARRIWVAGADIGTTYNITVGSGGAPYAPGGPTSFGALLTVAGGAEGGWLGDVTAKGAPGQPTGGTMTGTALAVGNASVAIHSTPGNIPLPFGGGGLSGAGAPGIVVIEW